MPTAEFGVDPQDGARTCCSRLLSAPARRRSWLQFLPLETRLDHDPPRCSQNHSLQRALSPITPSITSDDLPQFFNNDGEALLVDGWPGCPRTSAKCHYVHPDEPAWARSKPSRPRIDPFGAPYKPVASVSQASYPTCARTPPRTHTPPASMPPAHPRSPALGPSGAHSPPNRARTPPRPRSPPSGPRILPALSGSRPRTPIRRTPSPRRPASRERYASASDSRYARERTGSNASTSAPSRRQDTRPTSPHVPRASSSGTGTTRERHANGITTSIVRPGSVGSDRMRDQSPATPATPLATTSLLEGRFQPILMPSRTQPNGVKPQASPHSATMPQPSLSSMPPPPTPPSHSDPATKGAKSPQKELSFTEKRDLWVDRIKCVVFFLRSTPFNPAT